MSDGELSDLVNDIINAPLSVTQKLSAVKLLGVDYVAGRIDVEGACRVCGQTNVWKNIKLLTTNFLSCEKCGQKYSIPLPDSLLENIEKNIGQILGKYGKVGIWAVNFNTSYLFKKAKLFSSDGILPIDISETKRKMNFHGKKIYPPEIVNIQALKVIVVAIPAFMEQIETQVRTFYKGVIHVIDLCDLLNPDYKI